MSRISLVNVWPFLLLALLSIRAPAQINEIKTPIHFKPVTEDDIQKIYNSVPPFENLNDRLIAYSQFFLKKPYYLGPAGEGEEGDLDQKPLSNWEQFDCVTYVEAVLALSMVSQRHASSQSNLLQYYDNIKSIKYHSEDISFLTRNHFTELDWIPYLNKIDLLKDVTRTVYRNSPKHSKVIDKHKWFMEKTLQDLYLPDLNDEEKRLQLENFKEKVLSLNLRPKKATLRYVPLAALLSPQVQRRLPKISIFSLIRGTHPTIPNIAVMVSHQGFLIKKNKEEIFIRHASTSTKTVMDIPLNEYVANRLQDKWPSLGLNLQVVLED